MSSQLFVSIVFLASIFFLEGRVPFIPGRNKRLSHAGINMTFALGNAVIGIVFFEFMKAVGGWSDRMKIGLLSCPGDRFWLNIVLVVVFFDLWMYAWHRLAHEFYPVWRIHRMHHIDQSMDCTTALRFHPFEIIISYILNLPIMVLLGMNLQQYLVYQAILFFIITFHHSNIALPARWDKVLRLVVVSPNMHRVHHSQVPQETNSNYGSVFSVWDRLFHSHRERFDLNMINYGVRQFPEAYWQGIRGMFEIPLHK